MEFNVVKKSTYRLTQPSLESFKERMIERLEEEMECEDFPYTIDDISDDLVREALTDVVQDAFECCDYCHSGVEFDDYFGTISLDCGEDDVSDAIYEAMALWRDQMEV